MLNHGLDAPVFAEQDGYFLVTLPGPNGDYDRLRVPDDASLVVSPAVEALLNDRQKQIMAQVALAGYVTRRWCVATFHVVNDTAGRDLKSLVALGLLVLEGQGRSAHYLPQASSEPTDNRPK